MKMGYEKRSFVFIFDIFYAALKIVKYIVSYTYMHHWYSFFF